MSSPVGGSQPKEVGASRAPSRFKGVPTDKKMQTIMGDAFKDIAAQPLDRIESSLGRRDITRYDKELRGTLASFEAPSERVDAVCYLITEVASSVFSPPAESAADAEDTKRTITQVRESVFLSAALALRILGDESGAIAKHASRVDWALGELNAYLTQHSYTVDKGEGPLSAVTQALFEARCSRELGFEKEAIGEGAAGSVHTVFAFPQLAVKVIAARAGERGNTAGSQEFEALMRADSAHIPKVYYYAQANEKSYLFMEKIEGVNAFDGYMESSGPVDRARLAQEMEGWAQGLSDLHDRGIVMVDVKPENIMSNNGKGMLVDMGECRAVGERVYRATQGYIDPAIGIPPVAQPHSDIWSFGASMLDILTQSRDVAHTMVENEPSKMREHIQERFRELFPDQENKAERNAWFALIDGCLRVNPAKRLSIGQVIERVHRIQNIYKK